jgi:hypothetical protein
MRRESVIEDLRHTIIRSFAPAFDTNDDGERFVFLPTNSPPSSLSDLSFDVA